MRAPQLRKLVDAGIPVVSQTVLLRGVNDNADTLEALMRALVEARVKPYYLHHGDLAPGTAHFRTTIAEGQALMTELRRRLSGLAMPTYVLDIPGAFGKMPINRATLSQDNAGLSGPDPERRLASPTRTPAPRRMCHDEIDPSRLLRSWQFDDSPPAPKIARLCRRRSTDHRAGALLRG